MKTYYVIRSGWNAANQSAARTKKNPANNFESGVYTLVGVVEADSPAAAIEQVNATCYNNQQVFATDRLRSIQGLTAALASYVLSYTE